MASFSVQVILVALLIELLLPTSQSDSNSMSGYDNPQFNTWSMNLRENHYDKTTIPAAVPTDISDNPVCYCLADGDVDMFVIYKQSLSNIIRFDRETRDNYQVMVLASRTCPNYVEAGLCAVPTPYIPGNSSFLVVNVKVTDENDEIPYFGVRTYLGAAIIDRPAIERTYSMMTIRAYDDDLNDRLSYSVYESEFIPHGSGMDDIVEGIPITVSTSNNVAELTHGYVKIPSTAKGHFTFRLVATDAASHSSDLATVKVYITPPDHVIDVTFQEGQNFVLELSDAITDILSEAFSPYQYVCAISSVHQRVGYSTVVEVAFVNGGDDTLKADDIMKIYNTSNRTIHDFISSRFHQFNLTMNAFYKPGE